MQSHSRLHRRIFECVADAADRSGDPGIPRGLGERDRCVPPASEWCTNPVAVNRTDAQLRVNRACGSTRGRPLGRIEAKPARLSRHDDVYRGYCDARVPSVQMHRHLSHPWQQNSHRAALGVRRVRQALLRASLPMRSGGKDLGKRPIQSMIFAGVPID